MEGRCPAGSDLRPNAPSVPYIVSRYLGETIYLDEIPDLSERDLGLLDTEVHALHSECSKAVARKRSRKEDFGTVEKLLRTSGRFVHAIEREMHARQRKVSVLAILDQLNAVTSERDVLRKQLDHLLEQRVS